MDIAAEIRFFGTLGILVALLAGLGWLSSHERSVGKAEVNAKIDAAVAAQMKRDGDHYVAQTQALQGVADGYEKERDAALAHAGDPQPVVRVFIPAPGRGPVSCTSTSVGRLAGPAPAARELPGVPEGAGSGTDLGPGLHDLAVSADALLALARASQSSIATLERPAR